MADISFDAMRLATWALRTWPAGYGDCFLVPKPGLVGSPIRTGSAVVEAIGKVEDFRNWYVSPETVLWWYTGRGEGRVLCKIYIELCELLDVLDLGTGDQLLERLAAPRELLPAFVTVCRYLLSKTPAAAGLYANR